MGEFMKKLLPFAAAVVIAGGAYFTGAVTSSDAIKLAFDKEALKVECAKLVDGQ